MTLTGHHKLYKISMTFDPQLFILIIHLKHSYRFYWYYLNPLNDFQELFAGLLILYNDSCHITLLSWEMASKMAKQMK